ncbi:MAG: trigger factor [Myxococcales bacterium]|nr:trigger factor [Myxococcales bacterium]
MQSQVSEISPVEVEVAVQIPWDRVQKDLDEQFKTLGRSAKIRGFRPGKAPQKIVRQVFGTKVRTEVATNLIEAGLIHALQEHELQMVAPPQVDPQPIEDGKALSFTIKMEVRPKIETLDLEDFVIERPSAEVEDSAVDEEIVRLQRREAQVQEPDPMRPAKKGDLLTVDYTVEIDGELKDELGGTDRTMELGEGSLIEELEQGILGMSPGESKRIEITFPEDHPREDLRSKPAIFEFQIRGLKEQLLPELDDEFAQDCGEFATLLELRLDIRKRLETQAAERASAQIKERLIDALIEKNPIAVPPSMVTEQKQQLAYEMLSLHRAFGSGALPSDALEGMDDRAARRVRAGLLLGALARQESIEATDAEIDARLAQLAEQTGKHVAKLRAEYSGDRRGELESRVMEEKLMDFLLSRAKIQEGATEDGSATGGEG